MRTPSLCVCNAKGLSTSICNALNSLYKRILVRITETNTLNILITNENGRKREINCINFIRHLYRNRVNTIREPN